MKVYIDNDYKCHVAPGDGLREIDVPEFDGFCPEYVEGYRYVPLGEQWVNPNGIVFRGEMSSPWKPYDQLCRAQLEYELAQYKAGAITVADAEAAYQEGVNTAYD